MPDGEVPAIEPHPPSPGGSLVHEGVTEMVEFGENGGGETGCKKQEKNPRKIARKYQLDLCKKALEENIIVYLETGCGKTHIAVLLIYELGHLIRQPQKNVCVFLAPTVALVQQQANVIEDSTDFKVRVYSGGSNHPKSHHDWAKEMEEFEVLVMTPQILLRSLYHCFIQMDSIALLIFDECHHAQVKSSHPYAEIMKGFYKADLSKRPRIFGMTASPVVGKGASEPENLPKSINSLEKLLDAKVYSVEDKEELERYVASPVVKIYDYASTQSATTSSYMVYSGKLDEIKHQCILGLRNKTNDLQSIQSTKRLICRMHDNIVFCLENLGLWGALQATQLFSTLDRSELNELMEDGATPGDHLSWNRYLAQVADVLSSDCKGDGITSSLSDVEVLKEPFFSKKILRLIGILSSCRFQPDMKCIIFVNRIVTARSLSYILQNLRILSSWKCHFLVGVHAGLKHMSRKMMKTILEKFQTGKLNLLVATKVGEEGLDIQTCCLVIRFDLPETVASFIQSRGRARMPQSEYAFLVNSGNQKELDLIESFKYKEEKINVEIAFRTSTEVLMPSEERVYKVDTSGASISAGYAVSLLHHYCSKLPHDEYFDPRPNFYYIDDVDGTVCHVILPSNAPLHEIVSMPLSSMEAAKKDACLRAIEELHRLGALNSYLLPVQDNSVAEDIAAVFSDSGTSDDEDLVAVLHEMRVPSALKEAWTDMENPILNCYYIKFIPSPEDRSYKEFCLFVKAPLPEEVERMELDLHLSHCRSVMTKIIPLGTAEFNKEEIKLAEYFQELWFKVIFDRLDLVSESVPLGEKVTCDPSSSTFYLLLPVVLCDQENIMMVDWKIIRRCLSSPIFKTLAEATWKEINPSDINLHLANGCQSISNVKNSLIYVPYKNLFYFVTDICDKKNAHSPYGDSETLSCMQHLIKVFGIHLEHPEQPLLHAKPLSNLHNLLHNRKPEHVEARELDEYFVDLPPELCQLKIIGFSKDIGSSISLLPSVMHRLENLLVAIDLKHTLSASFPEGAEVTASRVLEALTTEKCQERFSLERLEVLGDAFLKYIVGRHLFLLHDTLDEGKLTNKRSNAVNNKNLFKMATKRNLQVYIRDQPFDPQQFFAFGHPCPIICSKGTESAIHSECKTCESKNAAVGEVRCSKGHHQLHKKTIADVVEALVGAFLVDSGFKAATSFLKWIGLRVNFEASQATNVCFAGKRFMPLADYLDIGALETLLGYQFLHKGLLLQAFVHPSYNKHGGGCYQRLEFLGDAVLDYLITSYLFSAYPKLRPGELTDLRSASVNNNAFANVAVDRSFQNFLISDSDSLSEAVAKYVEFIGSSLGRGSPDGPKCPKVLGDLVESCFGAILLDTGFDLNRVWMVMLSFLDPIKNLSSIKLHPVRELRELCQSHNLDLQFPESKKGGNFLIEAKVNLKDGCVAASAINKSKWDAIRIASEKLVEKLKALGYKVKNKSLEEILKATCKMDARLIGYDETPTDVAVPDSIAFAEMRLSQSFGSVNNADIPSTSNGADNGLRQSSLDEPEISHFEVAVGLSGDSDAIANCGTKSRGTGKLFKGTARSHLYEICSANYWKTPLFECCEEKGPSHLREFTYKVTMEIEEVRDMILECYGDPKSKKTAAAESAAEAALWYLQRVGYV